MGQFSADLQDDARQAELLMGIRQRLLAELQGNRPDAQQSIILNHLDASITDLVGGASGSVAPLRPLDAISPFGEPEMIGDPARGIPEYSEAELNPGTARANPQTQRPNFMETPEDTYPGDLSRNTRLDNRDAAAAYGKVPLSHSGYDRDPFGPEPMEMGMDDIPITDFNVLSPHGRGVQLNPPGTVGSDKDPFFDQGGYFGTPPPISDTDFPEVEPLGDPYDEGIDALPRVDAENVPVKPDDGNNVSVEQIIADMQTSDPARSGGQTFNSFNPDAEWNVGSVTPVRTDGFGAGLRGKVGSFFGHDSEEELQRFGSALSGFGTGLLTGGADWGSALGNAFQKSNEAFHGMRKDQRQAALADHKMVMDEERRNMDREKMNEWRRQTARSRLSEDPDALVRLKRDSANLESGYDIDEDGNWYRVGATPKLPDDVKDMNATIEWLKSPQGAGVRDESRSLYDQALEILDKKRLGAPEYDPNAE